MTTKLRTRSWLSGVTVLAVAAGGLALSAAAPAAADTTAALPPGTTLHLAGRGFGHGHGLSQYGAKGAALEGKTYGQILHFYYPGTKVGRAHGPIRVLLGADTTPDVVVSPALGLSVRDLATGSTHLLGSALRVTLWRIVSTPAGGSLVQYRNPSGWRPSQRFAGEAEFFAAEPLTLWVPSGSQLVSRTYRGSLRSASPTPGSSIRDTVNVVGLDAYVSGVVPYEMPASWPAEALRAQAVAARSYAIYIRAAYRSRYYQICDTTSCQVYGGTAAELGSSNSAVRATARSVLRYQGSPALTQFSSSSGGWTADGGLPYLPAQQDSYDAGHANPYHRWTRGLGVSVVNAKYPQLGGLVRVRVPERTGDGKWGGRAVRIRLVGRQRSVSLTGDQFRLTFGLPSNWFSFGATGSSAAATAAGALADTHVTRFFAERAS